MRARFGIWLAVAAGLLAITSATNRAAEPRFKKGIEDQPLFLEDLDVRIPEVSSDSEVRLDYDIVYVRAKRAGDKVHKRFYTDFSQPVTMEAGADLMLLHPDGSEELLVAGGEGSITDPVVSFDGEWVYFVHIYHLKNPNQWSPAAEGADIFKIHLKTKTIVRLTNQQYTPNTGAADWSENYRPKNGKDGISYGVYNMGPYPLPGGRIVFTSNRDGFRPTKGYPAMALQLFVMDDADESVDAEDPYPNNIEKIGHLNLAGALHPVTLADGRIMFSTLESQGIRSEISWGIWTIHPDGTNWNPMISAFDPGGASNGFHFQTQLSDRSVIVEEYYNQNNSGFGAYIKLSAKLPAGTPGFGPGNMHNNERNPPLRFGRFYNGKGQYYRLPFMPTGSESLTPFALNREGPADPSILKDENSPKVGKFTHPSGAPDNHMLTVYSPGPVNHQYTFLPQLDGGLYLLKKGEVVSQPSELRLIKNDPDYNECWPRAVVPYERIYGLKEPKNLAALKNDGSKSKLLPEGSPFGLVGSSSLMKRESYPNGDLLEGTVTASYPGGNDPWKGLDAFTSHGNGMPHNWHNQGSDAGLYSNEEIHAVRILAMEPTTDRRDGPHSGRRFYNHAHERFRVLGEIPVRKFENGKEPDDPDGNPDTSFMARIPADTAFTFQTLDKNGLVLNMAQTWHQLRPGEVRYDCGGCHAHSQQPTDFHLTAAAKPDYQVWDLINETPLVTDKSRDETQTQWDAENQTGLRLQKDGPLTVEYHRDIKPIFERSCIACHAAKEGEEPAGLLNLNADTEMIQHEQEGQFPGTYYRLALDNHAKFGHKPVGYDSWGYPNASRTVRMLQSRRSLLIWKVFGKRLDGFTNDDHPSEPEPGAGYFTQNGEKMDTDRARARYDLDYLGSEMPPPEAVEKGLVKPLTDEDRRTLARWIDLGCPIDRDYDPNHPEQTGYGWMLDDNRPILTVTEPAGGKNEKLSRILIGMHDYYTGLEEASFTITADFPVDGIPPGTNLAEKFQTKTQGVWEYRLKEPVEKLQAGTLKVSVKDRQGNTSQIVRRFSVE